MLAISLLANNLCAPAVVDCWRFHDQQGAVVECQMCHQQKAPGEQVSRSLTTHPDVSFCLHVRRAYALSGAVRQEVSHKEENYEY
jgi:hypothetical protein